MPVREYFQGRSPIGWFMEDPLGNILEIYSHSYELTYSAGAYVQLHAHPQPARLPGSPRQTETRRYGASVSAVEVRGLQVRSWRT
jgi:hypothetical protein